MKIQHLALVLLALPFASCHSMRGQGPPVAELRSKMAHVTVTPDAVESADRPVPATDGPLRVGIAPPVAWASDSSAWDWHGGAGQDDDRSELSYDVWSDEERAILDRHWQSKLGADPKLSDTFARTYAHYEAWAKNSAT